MKKIFATIAFGVSLMFVQAAYADTHQSCIQDKFRSYADLMKQQHMFFKTHAANAAAELQSAVSAETEFQIAFVENDMATFEAVYKISPERLNPSLPIPFMHSEFSVAQNCAPVSPESSETVCRFNINDKMKALLALGDYTEDALHLQEKIDRLNNKNFLKQPKTPSVKAFYKEHYPKMMEQSFFKELQKFNKTPEELGCAWPL